MKKHTQRLLFIILLTLLVLGISVGVFYWFAYRPSEIRKSCYWETNEASPRVRDDVYRRCLMKNGLKVQGF
jgi:flagellar basal body-associated protein FliL